MPAALSPSCRRAATRQLLAMHHRARIGHVGGNLSALDALLVLHHCILTPKDRFILSKGHSAGALYIALWSTGQLSENDLDSFHADNTLLAGHPPAKGLEGSLFATGSLGHGLSLAAGCALALKKAGQGGRVFCLTSDGEWQEGSTWEAAIFAAHQNLDNLTILVDQNGLQGFGSTHEVASMADLAPRLQAFHLDVHEPIDGHNPEAIERALKTPSRTGKPTVLLLQTQKGHGIKRYEGKMESHYLPLTDEDLRIALDALGEE